MYGTYIYLDLGRLGGKCIGYMIWLYYHTLSVWKNTPLKFNMEPEKKSLEKETSFWKPSFSGSMLNFGGVFVFIHETCNILSTGMVQFFDSETHVFLVRLKSTSRWPHDVFLGQAGGNGWEREDFNGFFKGTNWVADKLKMERFRYCSQSTSY